MSPKRIRLYAAHKRWRQRNQAKGLTADGKPRTKALYHMNTDLKALPAVDRRRIQCKRYRDRQGAVPSPLEQAWRQFRAAMTANNND